MMKIKYGLFILSIIGGIALLSCDKIEGSYLEETDMGTIVCDTPAFPALSAEITKKVLIEEFTGQYCGTCPSGHVKLHELEQQYGDAIVAYAIHTTSSFAAPRSEEEYVSKGMYQSDYRTDDGQVIAQEFGVTDQNPMVPSATFNRIEDPVVQSYVYLTSFWDKTIGSIFAANESAGAGIQIIADYDAAAQQICCHVKTTFLKDYTEPINMVVCLVEDSIVDWQQWYTKDPQHIPNYTHRHVFRDAVNTPFGMLIEADKTVKDAFDVKSYGIALKGKNYNEEHLSIIAYIINAETKEVLQVEEAKVMS